MIWKLIMKLFGWEIDKDFPKDLKRCVLIAAPHTSNWDFIFAIATFKIMGINIRFTIKDAWVKFPFGLLTKPLGAIAIDRSKRKEGEKRKSMVDYMIDLFSTNKDLVLIVTAEGTRKKVENWKTGFYHVAKNAHVPIALGYLDYEKKVAGIRKELLYLTDSMEYDMNQIMEYYRNSIPKHPEDFMLDARYV